MSTRGCFCCPNICLNMKSSKQEGESLNTQISLKHSCWLKVKVKALEKSRATSKSVLCAYLHAVQYVVRFSSGGWEPSSWSRTRRRCRHFCFSPRQTFLPKQKLREMWSSKLCVSAPLWLHSQPCKSSGSFPPSRTCVAGCSSSGFQSDSQVVRQVFTAVRSPTVGSASPRSPAWSPHGPCRRSSHLKRERKKSDWEGLWGDSWPVTCSGTFDIQHHAREGDAVDDASHLGGPGLDGLTGFWPQNRLGSWLNVAHDLKAHGWDQLQRTHVTQDQVISPEIIFHHSNKLSVTLFFRRPSW